MQKDKNKADTSASNAAASGVASTDNMAQVRELLFGEHLRLIEDRFKQLEQQVTQQFESLRDDFLNQIAQESNTRDQELNTLDEQLKQQSQDQENRTSALEDDIRALLQAMNSDLQNLIEAVQKQQQQDQDQLQQHKVGREQLADLLSGLANQLRQDSGSSTAAD